MSAPLLRILYQKNDGSIDFLIKNAFVKNTSKKKDDRYDEIVHHIKQHRSSPQHSSNVELPCLQ